MGKKTCLLLCLLLLPPFLSFLSLPISLFLSWTAHPKVISWGRTSWHPGLGGGTHAGAGSRAGRGDGEPQRGQAPVEIEACRGRKVVPRRAARQEVSEPKWGEEGAHSGAEQQGQETRGDLKTKLKIIHIDQVHLLSKNVWGIYQVPDPGVGEAEISEGDTVSSLMELTGWWGDTLPKNWGRKKLMCFAKI